MDKAKSVLTPEQAAELLKGAMEAGITPTPPTPIFMWERPF